jgi:hypothetical protein
MNIQSRASWGARPAESFTAWDPDDLQGIAVHHFAIPRSAATPAGSEALMRAVQNAHMAGEFSDIAYNHCFDKWGQIFEARGFNRQTGANGNQTVNRTHAAICYMGNSDLDGFPEAAQDAAAWLIKQWFNRGTGLQVLPHQALSPDGTACPGTRAKGWVTSGAWKADLPSTRFVQYFLRDDGIIIDRSVKVPIAESLERWRTFSESDAQRKAHDRMAAEGMKGEIGFVRKVSVV